MLDTDHSIWLQWTHHKAQLRPSTKMVAPLGKQLKKGQKHWTVRGGGNKKEKQRTEEITRAEKAGGVGVTA